MKLFFAYLSFSISIVFMSWIVGMLLTTLIRKTNFYNGKLSNLNFLPNENVNNIIGVNFVKWMVKHTFFRYLNQKLKTNNAINLTTLKILRTEMSKAEVDHLFAFCFALIFMIVKIVQQEFLFAVIMLAINLLMNLYPSLLQQQNKRRINKLILRLEK